MEVKEIWKYKIKSQTTKIEMPNNAEILSVQERDHEFCVWVMFARTNKPRQTRTIEFYFTGQAINGSKNLKHISTVQCSNGEVYHFYELLNYL